MATKVNPSALEIFGLGICRSAISYQLSAVSDQRARVVIKSKSMVNKSIGEFKKLLAK